MPATQFYHWRNYRCAYEVWQPDSTNQTPLLLIHPIGVGLSRRFWDRFIHAWLQSGQLPSGQTQTIYNPDLLGCGESDMPKIAYKPEDWAAQLLDLIQTVIQQPVIVLAQGALFPVAIELAQKVQPGQIRGLVLSGPPAWPVMTRQTPDWQQKLSWNLFDSPLGLAFYQYAQRRGFIERFSIRQLFAEAAAVDAEWLNRLATDAKTQASRHAVFSFLAGFWRKDYTEAISKLDLPTLVVLGNTASSISRSGKSETPDERMADYLKHLPHGQGVEIAGRNVLPYESTQKFVEAIKPFVAKLSA
jgi:pimeloyl-ACP methyl ester carboxylesterase